MLIFEVITQDLVPDAPEASSWSFPDHSPIRHGDYTCYYSSVCVAAISASVVVLTMMVRVMFMMTMMVVVPVVSVII